jgi:UDP-glucose 4-epimerase
MRALASRTVVVTGAGGFIGSALTELLLEQDALVRALIGTPGAERAAVPKTAFGRYGDINDTIVLDELMKGAQIVVHLAASPSVAASFEDPAECARVSVAGTAAVVAAARRAGVHRVVYISSAEVYGPNSPLPVDEAHQAEPVSPYAVSKLEAEAVIDAAVRASSLEAVILRLFSVFGPGMSSSSVLMSILRQVEARQPVSLADLRPVRDYCYVEDVVEAIALGCIRPLTRRLSIYNIGTGVGTSVADLVARVFASLGLESSLRQEPSRRRHVDIFSLVSDSSRAWAELGWRSRTSLSAGLERLLESRLT